MRLALDLLLASAIGLVLGLGSAYYAVENGAQVDATRIGPWVASPNAGTTSADPYSAAAFARTGELALGPGEGIAFIASTDSAGRTLNGACSYTLDGTTPPARLWTLTAVTPSERNFTGRLSHRGLHSGELLWNADGTVKVTVAKGAHSGNWLKLEDTGPFRLVLRLYDTPLSSGEDLITEQELTTPTMPAIHAGACS